MILLRSYAQALELGEQIPRLALLRMRQLEGDDGRYDPDSHGHLVVLEAGDRNWTNQEYGDDPLFEYVRYVVEGGQRIYEAVVAVDNEKMVGVIIPESVPIPPELRQLLEATAERETKAEWMPIPEKDGRSSRREP